MDVYFKLGLLSWIEGSKDFYLKEVHTFLSYEIAFYFFSILFFPLDSYPNCFVKTFHLPSHQCLPRCFYNPSHLPWLIVEHGQNIQCPLCRGSHPSLAGPLSTLTGCSVCPDLLTLSPPLAASSCSESPTQPDTHTVGVPPLFNRCSEPFDLNCWHCALPGTDLRGHSTQSLPGSRAPHTGRIACLSLFQSVFALMCMQQFSCTVLLPMESHSLPTILGSA